MDVAHNLKIHGGQDFQSNGGTLAVHHFGQNSSNSPQLIWGHGWGLDHTSLAPLAQKFAHSHSNFLLDFPGFGAAPVPPASWGPEEYTSLVIEWLKTLPKNVPRIWVAHSFGTRIGIRLAERAPELIDGLFLIGGAGLKRQRSYVQQLRFLAKVYSYKCIKHLVNQKILSKSWQNRFGSQDYQKAGPLRPILVRVVNEDLSILAQQISCPVHLVYGRQDTETPPEFGERYAKLIKKSKLTLLDHCGHNTILTQAQAQVCHLLQQFCGEASGNVAMDNIAGDCKKTIAYER